MTINYTVSLTEKQCRVLETALDFYYRIGMGQIERILHVAVPAPGFKPQADTVDRDIAMLKMDFLGWSHIGTAHSIGSPELPDEYRVACDIHDVIRQRLAVDGLNAGEKGFGVAFDPIWQRGKEPLAKIDRENT